MWKTLWKVLKTALRFTRLRLDFYAFVKNEANFCSFHTNFSFEIFHIQLN